MLADTVALATWLRDRAKELGIRIAALGAGVAELVDGSGQVTSGHTIRWTGMPVRETFDRIAPATIESDVRAAALAESLLGAGRDSKHFVYVTVGTGISSCFVQNGVPFAGARGNALVLASSPVTTQCSHCGAVLEPVLEEFASGPALAARFSAASGRTVTAAEEVLEQARLGDAQAAAIVTSAGEALGVAVGWLVNVLDPEAVIVGGGLGVAGGAYWESFTASARRHVWAEASRDLPIRIAALGPNAGLIGAAAAAWLQTKAKRKGKSIA